MLKEVGFEAARGGNSAGAVAQHQHRPRHHEAAVHRELRAVQREQLAQASARARAGRITVAMVGGRSGMGKSALVQHFLSRLPSSIRIDVHNHVFRRFRSRYANRAFYLGFERLGRILQ